MKIGQYLAKIWSYGQEYSVRFFLAHPVYDRQNVAGDWRPLKSPGFPLTLPRWRC